jgi:hypothetical protein
MWPFGSGKSCVIYFCPNCGFKYKTSLQNIILLERKQGIHPKRPPIMPCCNCQKAIMLPQNYTSLSGKTYTLSMEDISNWNFKLLVAKPALVKDMIKFP